MRIDKSWESFFREELQKSYMKELFDKIKADYQKGITIYPAKQDIFNAFAHTSLNNLKAVIVGQDPYHNPGQAHGLAFSVMPDVKLPPSLRNIFLELKDDLNVSNSSGFLTPWAKQGVLLLNSSLTVRKNSPKSHSGWGWETFTDRVIEYLDSKKKYIVFILWGRAARDKCSSISDRHSVLEAGHPSPFSVKKFLGCKHFSKTNSLLLSKGIGSINWQL